MGPQMLDKVDANIQLLLPELDVAVRARRDDEVRPAVVSKVKRQCNGIRTW
jgi:hypothetical protein